MVREVLINFRTGALDAAKRSAEALKKIATETLKTIKDPDYRAKLRGAFREEQKVANARVDSAQGREEKVRANAFAEVDPLAGVSGARAVTRGVRALEAVAGGSWRAVAQLTGAISPALAEALGPAFALFLATEAAVSLINTLAEKAITERVDALSREAVQRVAELEFEAAFEKRMQDPAFAARLSAQAFRETLAEERQTGRLRQEGE